MKKAKRSKRATVFPGSDAYQRLKVATEVYAAIADLEDATDADLIAHVSKRLGRKVTPAQFKRAIAACSQIP